MHGQDAVHKKEVNKMKKKHTQMVKHLKLGIGVAGVCDWDQNSGTKQTVACLTRSLTRAYLCGCSAEWSHGQAP